MSLLAALAAVGTGLVAAVTAARHQARRALVGYRTRTRQAMEAQHHAPPYVQRIPGQTLAAYPPPTAAEIEAWETDDILPATDLWCAWYPPGSLGHYPDGKPSQPGRLSVEDGVDVVRAAIRLAREAADRSTR